MGRAIAAAAEADEALATIGADAGDDVAGIVRAADALTDFSSPGALHETLRLAVEAGTPVVIGTTGLEAEHHGAIDAAARRIAVLQTGNTSLGVAMLAALVARAAAGLGSDWDVEIVEMHHRHKVDAPSGTALLLGEAVANARGVPLDAHSERGRDGHTGARGDGAIGFASLRGGTVAGDHRVILAGEGERIELAHVAEDRAIFARGAIRAARWLIGRAPGRYAMNDLLDL